VEPLTVHHSKGRLLILVVNIGLEVTNSLASHNERERMKEGKKRGINEVFTG
jgi:hypothetical protein